MSQARRPTSRLRMTRRYELMRQGIWKPVGEVMSGSGLAILVALQYFEAADWQKGLLSGAPYWGLFLGPLVVLIVGRLGISVSAAIGGCGLICATGLLVASSAPTVMFFIVGVLMTTVFMGITPPLSTALWRQNVAASIRGRLFGVTAIGGGIAALISSGCISLWMGDEPSRFRPVFIILALLMATVSYRFLRLPSQPLDNATRKNPLSVLHLLWSNKLFGYLSLVWMIMGFGNLMTIPLRVEYAGSAERGLELSPGMVVLMTLVLPEFAGMLATLVWSRLFDRINFMILRMLINVFFLASILVYFSGGFTALVIGSLLFGIAKGGGQLAWNLWVTKFSEPDRTADYMSVHTFLTGVRGISSGYLSFLLLSSGLVSIHMIGWTGAAMIGFATVMIFPIVRYGRKNS